MRMIRIILGAILAFVGLLFLSFWMMDFISAIKYGFVVKNLYSSLFFLLPGLFFGIFSILFLGNKFSIFSIFSIFLGIITIFCVIPSFYGGVYGESTTFIIGVMGSFLLFGIGVFTVFPARFYQKSFIPKLGYLFSALLILLFLFNLWFFAWRAKEFSGDFMVAPLLILSSLLPGIFCIPILIIKIKSKKITKILHINN